MNLSKFTIVGVWSLLLISHFSKIVAQEPLTYDRSSPIKISTIKENPPFSLPLPDGTQTGLYVEFWRLWSEVNNIPVEIIPMGLVNSIEMARTAQVDMHIGLFVSNERKKWGEFSLPFHKVETGVFFRSSDNRLPRLKDMAGKKVATQVGTFQHEHLRKAFPDIQLVTFDDVELVLTEILKGNIDAIVGEVPYLYSVIAQMGLVGVFERSKEVVLTSEVHGLVPNSRIELLPIINAGINNIPVNKVIALEKKWMPNLAPFFSALDPMQELTLREKEWLRAQSVFTLGIDKNSPPFEFIDEKGEFVGISSEYVDIVSNQLGIKFQPGFGEEWIESFNALKAGEIDVMSAVVMTEERAQSMHFSEPYISFATAIIARKDSSYIRGMNDLTGKRVGIVRGFVFEEYVRRDYPEVIVVYSDSLEDSVQKLKDSEIDAAVGSLVAINNELNKGHSELKVAAFTPYDFELSFAVRKGLEPLVPILNKALSKISTKEKAKIANNWLSVTVNLDTNIKIFIYWGLPIVIILLFIIIFVSRANRKMQFEIFERKKTEILLENLKNKAERANQAKDNFLANMSHEFRTPMNAVVGMSHLLEESGLTGIQKEYNQTLHNSAASLLVLIDDILDLSKVEAGKLELEIRPFKLADVIKNIENQVRLIIDNQVVNLKSRISPEVPQVLLGDAIRFGQVLLNLANNAAKFTHKGEITILVEVESRTEDKIKLKVFVRDSGIGMNYEQQARLFKTYSQADSSITRKYGGTGLGLAISQKLTELMKGSIGVESEVDKGSCFFFTVEFGYRNGVEKENIGKEKTKERGGFSDLLSKKILLVDDNQVNLIVAKTMLTNAGVDVVTALNGVLAIEALEETDFDAILMDIQMPDMDGYETTRYIRNEMNLKDIPIIAVSANVMKSDIDKSFESGMNAHIGKPLNFHLLLQTLASNVP